MVVAKYYTKLKWVSFTCNKMLDQPKLGWGNVRLEYKKMLDQAEVGLG